VAVASLDKCVSIWDFRNKNLILLIELPKGGVHSIAFFQQYQLLITAGF
jgi:WD40 repeat protein